MQKRSVLKTIIWSVSFALFLVVLFELSERREEMMFKKSIEKLLTEELSELSLPLSSKSFKSFDKDDIEEGRLYFWIKENGTNPLHANIYFFILQSREFNLFKYEECYLKEFNAIYNEAYPQDDSEELALVLEKLLKLEKEGFKQIAQEEIINTLSGKEYTFFLTQKPKQALYFEDHLFELCENSVVTFMIDEKKPHYTTLFFNTYDEGFTWLNKEIKRLKSDGYVASNKEKLEEIIVAHKQREIYNSNYEVQKESKQKLLERYPQIKAHFKDAMDKFMKYSPLEVIEGDHNVTGDFLMDGNKSLFITGDLKVSCSLSSTEQANWRDKTFFIVLGNTYCENYVYADGTDTNLFMGDLNVENFTYLPSPTRNWNITLKGKLKTKILIRGNCETIKDKEISFQDDYCTEQKEFFVPEIYKQSGYVNSKSLFDILRQGKSVLNEELNITKEDKEQQRILLNFKQSLENWHSLYYSFAGFELKELPIGEHYGYYIESDEIVEDVRHGTGLYLMSHDDQSLERVKEEKDFVKDRVKTKILAYRLYWIMFTFSNWKHRFDTPLDYWESAKQIDEYYEREKEYLVKDTHLALYWVMHFGLLDDDRLKELETLFEGTDNELLQGAFLFFKELKNRNKFTIKIDYKENDTLFTQRLQKAQLEIEKNRLSKENQIVFLLSGFEKSPTEVVSFVRELHTLKQDEKVLEELKKLPYQEGYSILYVLLNHEREKWYETFLEEFFRNKKNWKQAARLIQLVSEFYKELDVVYLSKTVDIFFGIITSLNNKETKLLQAMMDRMKSLEVPKEKEKYFRVKLLGIEKANLDFQGFANLLGTIKFEDAKALIYYCIEQKIFDEGKISDQTFSPYGLLYYVADKDFYPVSEKEREALVNFIVTHYKLSKEDYKEKSSDVEKNMADEFLKPIEKLLP